MRAATALILFGLLQLNFAAQAQSRPNILLIITDDQGYGDLGIHGNSVVKTPSIDALARESVRLDRFYVSPVCSPTRASLLTGRYNYRTGVVDTYLGRSMMRTEEITLAEILRDNGYRTGIFGKWHLGDHYPMRPNDQGFETSLIHHGGGIGQPSDPPEGSSYFNPVLYRNGEAEKTKGYCSDVYTDALINFIGESSDRPFFAYLAFNAPHTPLEVAPELVAPYAALNMTFDSFPGTDRGIEGAFSADTTAKIYAMVSNIDENVGRALTVLRESSIADNTIVIFMTDNGPQQPRFNAGMRGLKSTVFEGGIRVPFFIRWPQTLEPRIERTPLAHIDVLPTLLEASGIPMPTHRIDGRSFWPLLKNPAAEWTNRYLVFQSHRGDTPERGRAYAVIGPRYKLVQPLAFADNVPWQTAKPMLFDLAKDPYEQHDVSTDQPDRVATLQAAYDTWFTDVTAAGFDLIRISIGTPHENPVLLTQQDWRGPHAAWGANAIGYWEVEIMRNGTFGIEILFSTLRTPCDVVLKINGVETRQRVESGADTVIFKDVQLDKGHANIAPLIERDSTSRGVDYVRIFHQGLDASQ